MLYERQKSLLALLDALGGSLAAVDFQKLLFLWNRELGERGYYDFVPYRFGAFSHTSYADRRKLVAKGLLVEHPTDWTISAAGIEALAGAPAIKRTAADFAQRAPNLRGDPLIAHTYRRYPFFAVRSEVAAKVLGGDGPALEAIKAARPRTAAPGLVTIGYEGRSLECYLVRLLEDGVTILCDVRRNPLSRRYGFSRTTLSRACEGIGIRYEHLPELGIASEDRKGLHSQADYDALFEVYEREALPLQGAALARIAEWIAAGNRVALTCYERDPAQCHRHCVAEALERQSGRGLAATHL